MRLSRVRSTPRSSSSPTTTCSRRNSAMTGAPLLAGLRVLDMTQVLSGPYCTQVLADLGADVIKLEPPQGDLARAMQPHFIGEDSVYFVALNRNKRSVAIDLKQPEGVDLVRRL